MQTVQSAMTTTNHCWCGLDHHDSDDDYAWDGTTDD